MDSKKRPLYQKVFFSIYSYTLIYALFGALSLSYHACFNSSLGTLEKRYRFSSTTGGYIMITDNIATVLTNLFIGYYGKTAHKPRWMAFGCLMTGISVMVTALPYFIYGPARETDLELVGNMTLSSMRNGHQICMANNPQKEDCSEVSASETMTTVAVTLFAISNFFRGFGTSIYFTYGTPYLDDNISKSKMPSFFAFIFAARLFGSPIGFYFSSLALKVYEDPFSPPPGLTSSDPRWVGAWWIGFLVSGSLMLCLSVPLSLFPREFRKSKKQIARDAATNNDAVQQPSSPNEDLQLMGPDERRALASQVEDGENIGNDGGKSSDINQNRISLWQDKEANLGCDHKDEEAEIRKKDKSKELSLRELPRELWAILKNPMVVCQMLGNTFRGIGMIGYFVFQTKYLEAQFRQSASKASIISGTTGFSAKIMGVLLGGLLITLFRPSARNLTIYIFLVEFTSVFTLFYGSSVVGPQYNYPSTSLLENGQLKLQNSCNEKCNCDFVRYQPVCSQENMEAYFSPCHAGCSLSMLEAGSNSSVFTQCDCAHSSNTLTKCPPETDRLLRYATIVAVGGMISGSSRSGNMVTFFRSIKPDQKSLAVAFGSFWHSLFVSIPYPLIYGRIFDYCCQVWSHECGRRGNCWLYDVEKLRYVYHAFSIALIAIGSFFDVVMIFLSPRLGDLYDDAENKKSPWQRLKDRIWGLLSTKARQADEVSGESRANGQATQRPLKTTNL